MGGGVIQTPLAIFLWRIPDEYDIMENPSGSVLSGV
jgi:hypothetical protein